jgi:hypothetical protein
MTVFWLAVVLVIVGAGLTAYPTVAILRPQPMSVELWRKKILRSAKVRGLCGRSRQLSELIGDWRMILILGTLLILIGIFCLYRLYQTWMGKWSFGSAMASATAIALAVYGTIGGLVIVTRSLF